MTYAKQTWHDKPALDTPVTKARLDHIEDGIVAVDAAIAALPGAYAQALVATAVKTGPYTAAPKDYVLVDAAAASRTVTLPAAPADLSRIGVKMVAVGTGFTTTIACAGSDHLNLPSGGTTLTLSLLNQAVILQYVAGTTTWTVQADDLPLGQLDLRYAPIGGGGGTTVENVPTAVTQAALVTALALPGTTKLQTGTYDLRSPLVVGASGAAKRLTGMGTQAIIRKRAAQSTLLTANLAAAGTVVAVTSTAFLAVGDGVSIWDSANDGNLGLVTIGLVTAIAGLNVTIDTPAVAAYQTSRAAKLVSTFPIIRNATGATDFELDHVLIDGQKNSEDIVGSFQGASVSWIGAKRMKVHHCRIQNSGGDDYSDQGFASATWDTTSLFQADNEFSENTCSGAGQHGVHLGTGLNGGTVTDNLIENAASEGVHFSNTIQNTVIGRNAIRGCVRGVASLDAVSPYNTVTENVIEGGQVGIECGASYCEITKNTLRAQTSKAITVFGGAKHNQVEGNTVVLATGGANGIEVSAAPLNRVIGNVLRGGPSAGQASIYVTGSDNCEVSGNEVLDGYRGLLIFGSNGGVARSNGFENMVQNTIEVQTGATSSDWSFDDNRNVGVYFNLTDAPRHVINGMGDNGVNSPAVAGNWFGISGQRHSGRLVRWGSNRVSAFWSAVGWIEIPAAAGVPTFDPRVIPGLTALWKADLVTGLASLDPSDSAYDYSGHAKHLSATGTTRPLWVASVINGKPVWRADGVNDVFVPAGSILMSDLFSPTEYTYICVLRSITNDTNAANAYDNDAVWADSSGWIGLHLKSAGTIHAYDNGAAPSVAYTSGTPLLVAVRHGSGTVGISKNGGAETTGAQGTSTLTGQFRMFGGNGSSNLWNGEVAVLPMWNRRLTDAELAEAVGSYRTEYGL